MVLMRQEPALKIGKPDLVGHEKKVLVNHVAFSCGPESGSDGHPLFAVNTGVL
jgi:hypothetical protein